MKHVHEWLHCYLMRFAWYRRRAASVLRISDVTNEALKILEQNFSFTDKVKKRN